MQGGEQIGSVGLAVGAAIGAGVELFSPSELDTITVPIAILAVLLLFV